MLNLLVGDVVAATGAEALREANAEQFLERSVLDVTIDSRKVRPGSLFVCFKGARVDGNTFALDAVKAGAAAVVLTQPLDASEPNLHPNELCGIARAQGCALLRAEADDAEEFLRRLAEAWRLRNPQWTVVGVTGSVGKTTTKDLLAAGLSAGGSVTATPANLNTLIGCSLTLLSASAEDRFVVCEMGVDHVGDMAPLARTARPNLAVITNVGTSHLGNFGTREAIAREKAQIALGMADAPGAVAPCLAITEDNDFSQLIKDEYADPNGAQLICVGSSESCDVRALGLTLDELSRPRFDLEVAGERVCSVSPDVLGTHVVADILLAFSACWKAGIDLRLAAQAMEQLRRTALRMELKRAEGRPCVIDDSYNASPSSMAAALDVLSSMACEGRRIAVLGEIGELGADAPSLHGYVGAYVAAKGLDLVAFVGTENAGIMAVAARTMGMPAERIVRYATASEALEALRDAFAPQDLVLVKASRFMGLDAFAKGVLA